MEHLSMQQLEEMGFKVAESYTDGEFITQIRSKGVIQVQTTWGVKGDFISQELKITFLNFKPEELTILDKILNKN